MSCVHGGGLKAVADLTFLGREYKMNPETSFTLFDHVGIVGSANLLSKEKRDDERLQFKIGKLPSELKRLERPNYATTSDGPEREMSLSGYDRIVDHKEEDCLHDKTLRNLGKSFESVSDRGAEGVCVPAAYTYFGQFLAHEISRLNSVKSGDETVNLRSSAIDLDTIFFPAAEVSAQAETFKQLGIYERNGVGVGTTTSTSSLNDLPRRENGSPLIPDCRNDSNLQIAQMHVAISRHYLRLRQELKDPKQATAEITRRIQDIAIFDYLPKIIDKNVYQELMSNGERSLVAPHKIDPAVGFLVPVEFSAACFRFGHSQVRSGYTWSSSTIATLRALLIRTKIGKTLPGGKLSEEWAVDWSTMAGVDPSIDPDNAASIDHQLARELFSLSRDRFEGKHSKFGLNLATQTLLRSVTLKLPSAQSVFENLPNFLTLDQLRNCRLLSPDEICDVPSTKMKNGLKCSKYGQRPVDRTPLWIYTLSEARSYGAGQRLGPLASRIVAETIHASVESNTLSPPKFDDLSKRKVMNLSEFLNYSIEWTPESLTTSFT